MCVTFHYLNYPGFCVSGLSLILISQDKCHFTKITITKIVFLDNSNKLFICASLFGSV